MKPGMKAVFVLVTFYAVTLQAANVIGYFTNWGIYGEQPYTARDIPYKNLTHIQYAFLKPESDGRVTSFDEYADEQILLGEMVWSPKEYHDSTTSLIYLAHKNNVKVLASIGGWTGSDNFPALAGSAATRSNFCSNVRALVEQYGFDGVDIDWEFPCYEEHGGTANDAQNFVLLLAELRDTLDAMSGDKKLITLAIPGGSYHGKNFLVEQFHHDVDYISIMTYDYTGEWSTYAWHNSPLYDYGSDENWSLNRAMEYYLQRGVPASKLNIGMAFYGKSFTGCQGPNQPFTGSGQSSINYSVLVSKIESGEYTRYWDETAMVPYCLSSTNEYFSFDDTLSIGLKAEYCMEKGFGGAIIWELKAGRLSDGTQPLLSTAASILMSGVSVKNEKPRTMDNLEALQVIYCTSGPRFRLRTEESKGISFAIYELSGRTVLKGNIFSSTANYQFSIPGTETLHCGKYLLRIDTGDKKYHTRFSIIK